MNGARSTFQRKGYLLTALAAAVLLAASPGIASAQEVGFVGSASRTMGEGASPAMDTAAPIEIEFRISDLVTEGAGQNTLGTLTIQHNADVDPPGSDTAGTGSDGVRSAANRRIWIDSTSAAVDASEFGTAPYPVGTAAAPHTHLYGVDDGDQIPYDNNGVIKLVIIDPGGDEDWVNTSFTMTLRADGIGVTPNPGSVTVTITDGDPAPVATFTKTDVSLTEDSQTSTDIGIAVGAPRGETASTGVDQLTNNIQFTTSPAGAVAVEAGAADDGCDAAGNPVLALTLANIVQAVNPTTSAAIPDTFQVSQGAGTLSTAAPSFSIQACMDDAGFRDDMVTFSFVASSLTGAPMGMGNVAAGPNLVVTVQSEGEETPVVSFATTSINIDEGSTEAVAILADGLHGHEVGSVMVHKGGDAVLSLWQGMEMLESEDGEHYEVSLVGSDGKPSANTVLTISADSDRALEDGMTSTGMLTIESANEAEIGDRNTLEVTVRGSTAVPALPLVGQLLLALFLMAGGARLYRRRNG